MGNVEAAGGDRQVACHSRPITAELTNQMPALTSLGFASPFSWLYATYKSAEQSAKVEFDFVYVRLLPFPSEITTPLDI